MKVGELRKTIEKYNKKELSYIVAELYKAFPKKMLLEKSIDYIVENPDSKKVAKAKKIVEIPDIDELYDEVVEFCEDAMADLYFAPNRTIPKKERAGWRFKVIKMYKGLMIAKTEPNNLEMVGLALVELYKVLCHGCGYHIFASIDTFRAIKVSQVNFLEEILKIKFQVLPAKEAAELCISLIIESGEDSDTFTSQLMEETVVFFKTDEDVNYGVGVCENLIKKTQNKRRTLGGYKAERVANNYAEVAFRLYMKIYQQEKAIAFFDKYYSGTRDEVTLYVLMHLLEEFAEDELITKVYKRAVAAGITPRSQLTEMYNKSL